MGIFKDGRLDMGKLNPQYRSIADGWPCGGPDGEKWFLFMGIDFCFTFKRESLISGDETNCVHQWTIKQFTHSEIPKGELCWFSDNGKTWHLSQFDRTYKESKNVKPYGSTTTRAGKDGYDFKYCVPYLIAETAQDAERLKGWHCE